MLFRRFYLDFVLYRKMEVESDKRESPKEEVPTTALQETEVDEMKKYVLSSFVELLRLDRALCFGDSGNREKDQRLGSGSEQSSW